MSILTRLVIDSLLTIQIRPLVYPKLRHIDDIRGEDFRNQDHHEVEWRKPVESTEFLSIDEFKANIIIISKKHRHEKHIGAIRPIKVP